MTKEEALHLFWSSFGLQAFEKHSVPTGKDAPKSPYLTYSVVTDSFETEVGLTANVWFRSSSWIDCNAVAEEIAETIGRGGVFLKCDGGKIWIKRGQPFAQSMGDDSDNLIKRKYINVTVEYLTEN